MVALWILVRPFFVFTYDPYVHSLIYNNCCFVIKQFITNIICQEINQLYFYLLDLLESLFFRRISGLGSSVHFSRCSTAIHHLQIIYSRHSQLFHRLELLHCSLIISLQIFGSLISVFYALYNNLLFIRLHLFSIKVQDQWANG